jgi:hypothetical protein
LAINEARDICDTPMELSITVNSELLLHANLTTIVQVHEIVSHRVTKTIRAYETEQVFSVEIIVKVPSHLSDDSLSDVLPNINLTDVRYLDHLTVNVMVEHTKVLGRPHHSLVRQLRSVPALFSDAQVVRLEVSNGLANPIVDGADSALSHALSYSGVHQGFLRLPQGLYWYTS